MSGEEPVVRLANDVGVQFSYLPDAEQPAAVARHLRTFWEPRMLERICEVVDAGGVGLEPVARAAAELIVDERRAGDVGAPSHTGPTHEDHSAENPAAEVPG